MQDTERAALIAELEAAKRELARCMGGVDPIGAVAASRRITALRSSLRDDSAMNSHFAQTIATPLSVSKRRHRAE